MLVTLGLRPSVTPSSPSGNDLDPRNRTSPTSAPSTSASVSVPPKLASVSSSPSYGLPDAVDWIDWRYPLSKGDEVAPAEGDRYGELSSAVGASGD